MPGPAILTRGLTKVFPPRRRNVFELMRRVPKKPAFTALHGVDLEVREGELYGLLGPNGAGKTTLVKILSTLLLPTEGDAIVAGHDVRTDAEAIRGKVGVVLGGDRALYWRLTARENLWYFSQLYDIPGGVARERIETALEEVGLTDRADDRVEDYSKGMKQRLHIARGLLTNPRILLLDEPTIGLDAHAARGLRSLVRKLVDEHARTVVLTTHYLYEADELSDRIGVLHKGKLIAVDTAARLKAVHAGERALLVDVRDPTDALEKSLAAFAGVQGVSRALTPDGATRFRLTGSLADDDIPSVAAEAARAGKLLGIRAEEPSLEDVFVKLTGAGMSDAEGGAK